MGLDRALAFFGFLLAVAFAPGLPDPATAPRWGLIAVAAPSLLAMAKTHKTTLGHALGGAFFLWALVSLAWTVNLHDGENAATQLFMFGIVFALGAALPSPRPLYAGMGIGLALNAALVIAQWSGALAWWWGDAAEYLAINSAQAATFMNHDYLAETAVLVTIGLLGMRAWRLATLVSPCLLLTGARGAILALAVAALARGGWRYPALTVCALLGLAVAVPFAARLGAPQTAGMVQRLDIWQDAASNLTWAGHGLGSFRAEFPRAAPNVDTLSQRPLDAHSDPLELVFELGVPGFALAAAFVIFCLAGPALPERLILIAFLTEGYFDFPLHLPTTGFLAALAAGHLCRDRPGLRYLLVVGRIRLRHGRMALRERGRRGGASGPSGPAVPAQLQVPPGAGLLVCAGAPAGRA